MAVRFFFEYEGQVVQLPVNPEKLIIATQGNNQSVEIVKLGDASVLRKRKLAALEVQSFLPATADAPYVLTKGQFQGPQFYLDFLTRVRDAIKPMRFIVSDMQINMLVSIEAFEYGKQGGDDDVYYSLKLKEFKPIGAKMVTIVAPTVSTTPTITTEPAVITTSPVTERPKTGFAVGDTVVVTGNYWSSSYGDPPSGVFNAFIGKIGHIVADVTRQYRFAIYTLEGGARGWVSADQLEHR